MRLPLFYFILRTRASLKIHIYKMRFLYLVFLLVPVLVNGYPLGRVGDLLAESGRDPMHWFKIWFPTRNYGYLTGDTLVFKVETLVKNGFVFSADKVMVGRISRWFERRISFRVRPEGRFSHYTIRIEYQVFYVPQGTEQILIPELPLEFVRFVRGEQKIRVVIPEFRFVVSSLTTEKERKTFLIADDIWPHEPDSAQFYFYLVALSTIVFASVAMWFGPLIWRRITLRAVSPFRKARAQIAGARTRREAYMVLHGALNFYAGRTVLAHELERFFGEHPEFNSIREELTGFFRRSYDIFFVTNSADNPICDGEKVMILELLKKLATAEMKKEVRR